MTRGTCCPCGNTLWGTLSPVRTYRWLFVLAALAACRKPPPPAPVTTTVGQNLHIEGVPGTPTVDIHALPDGGGTHVQIGAAQVDLPSQAAAPIPSENGP